MLTDDQLARLVQDSYGTILDGDGQGRLTHGAITADMRERRVTQHGTTAVQARDARACSRLEEPVTKGEILDVFLSDEGRKPVSAAGCKGTGILVVGGKPARVQLEPADGRRLTGKAVTAHGASPRGAVQLTDPDGATASGRFNRS